MKKIPWWEPQTGNRELKLVAQVIKSNFPNEGDFTTLFEEKIAGLIGAKYAIATPNCTLAIFLALKGLDIGHGDEVIVPDLSFIAASNAVNLTGAKPILADVEENTLNLDPQSFKIKITKKTRAVIPVHVSGRPTAMDKIIKIAKENRIYVVEDAAEGFMSKYQGKYLGTFGDAGCFSFSPAKTITTGQGGAIVTNSNKLYHRLKELKDQGRPKRGTGGDDLHKVIGYNFKFTNLQAAFGLGQLTYLKSRIERMKRNHQLYVKNLKGVKGIKIFQCDTKAGVLPQWTDAIVQNRDGLDKFLRTNNIDCRRFWFPIHTQIPYRQNSKDFPVSSKMSPKAIWLPSAFTLKDEDIKYVCKMIKKFLNNEK